MDIRSMAAVVIIGMLATGCATFVGSSSTQSFSESTPIVGEDGSLVYDTEGNVVLAVTEGRSKTVALPFGAKALTEYGLLFDLESQDEGAGYVITMGSSAAIDGGDMTAVIKALTGLVNQIGPLVEILNAVTTESGRTNEP